MLFVMKRALKLVGLLSVAVVLFLTAASLAFYYLVRVGEVRRFLIDEVEKNTALKVELGDAELELGWITGIAFRDLAVSLPDAAEPSVTAERVTARVALLPLLKKQVIFYEVRLQRPAARFVRDPDGRIELLDKLLNLPLLKKPETEFSLDLRTVKVLGGDIEYQDRRKDGIDRWRLTRASLELSRVRGQRLGDLMARTRQGQPPDFAGAALHFDLSSGVVKDSATMNLKARGRLLFPKENMALAEARWSADVELVDFPAALVQQQMGAALPIKSMSGHLGQRVHIDGNWATTLQVKGDLEFKQLSVEAPELLLSPLAGADGRVTFAVDLSPKQARIARADFRAQDMRFSLQGDIGSLDGHDPYFRLSVTGLSAPVSGLRKYLPLKLIDAPQIENTIRSIDAGRVEVKKAGVNASLAQLRRLAQSDIGAQIWFDAELRDLAGVWPAAGSLPVRDLDGEVSLANGVLQFRNCSGFYGDSHLSDAEGSYVVAPRERGKLELRLRADVSLAELKQALKSGLLAGPAGPLASSIEDLAGRSRVNLSLKRSAGGPAQIDGTAALDRVRLRYDDWAFSDLQGEIAFTPSEIKTGKMRAQLGGSPVQVQLTLQNYAAEDGSFDLAVESTGVRAGVVTSRLLDTGTMKDGGIISGSVRYTGALHDKSRRKLIGQLDLHNLQVTVRPLLQPLRELSGRISIGEAGIDFQNLSASLVGFPARASGRWRYHEKTQLRFDFSASHLDMTYLISQIDAESSDFYANLVAEGTISLGRGRIKNFEFTDLKTRATIDHRVWRLSNLTARSAGGQIQGVTTIFDRPDTLGVVAEPKVQGVPVQSFLNWFDITNTEMTGKVSLAGKLETIGKNDPERKRNLNGAFNLRIEDGTINRMRIIVQILNLLDLSRWFTLQPPDLAKQGIRFRSISADFKVTNGVYATENLIVDSNDLRMTGAGKIDVPNDELDFIVAVRPFAGIDSAISYIPLLGRSIAAIKNSLLVASFNISGRIDDPTITPAPLGTLSEWFWGVLGIPKNIIGFGDGAKPEEPKESAKPPAK
jgi:uncharacterized protein involved in outer membrane biogenesis